MKKMFSLFVLLVVATTCFSQTTKVVLTGDAVLHVQGKNGDSLVQKNAGEKLYFDSAKLVELQNKPAKKAGIANGKKRTSPNGKLNIDSLAKVQQQRTKDSLAAIALGGGMKPQLPSTTSVLSVVPIIPILIFLALLAIAAFIAKKIQAKRIAKRDLSTWPAMVPGGIKEENAADHMQVVATAEFGPKFVIERIRKGYISGQFLTVRFNMPKRFWRTVSLEKIIGYEGLISLPNGDIRRVYFLEPCGNRAKDGNFWWGKDKKIVFDPIVEEQQAAEVPVMPAVTKQLDLRDVFQLMGALKTLRDLKQKGLTLTTNENEVVVEVANGDRSDVYNLNEVPGLLEDTFSAPTKN